MNLQSVMLIPRIIEVVLFLGILVLLNRRYKEVAFIKRPFVHRLFFVGILGWFIYIVLDIPIFSLSALSFDPSIPIIRLGYDLEYPSLFIGNILRDVAFFGAVLESWCYFLVPRVIMYGEARVHTNLKKPRYYLTILALSLFLVFSEMVKVVVTPETVIIVQNYDGLGAFSLIFTTCLFIGSGFSMRKVLNTTCSEECPEFRKKIRYFTSGIFAMGMGYFSAIFWNILALFFTVLQEPLYFTLISFSIHFFWMLSPILIYKGFNLKIQQLDSDKPCINNLEGIESIQSHS